MALPLAAQGLRKTGLGASRADRRRNAFSIRFERTRCRSLINTVGDPWQDRFSTLDNNFVAHHTSNPPTHHRISVHTSFPSS